MTRSYDIDKDDPVIIIEQLEEEISEQAEEIAGLEEENSKLRIANGWNDSMKGDSDET